LQQNAEPVATAQTLMLSKHAEKISNSPRCVKAAELAELLNKQTALEATQENEHEATKDRDELTQDFPPAAATIVRPHTILKPAAFTVDLSMGNRAFLSA
jgi:hypothetical protein